MVKKYFEKLEEQINLFHNIVSTYSITTKYYNRYKGYILGNIIFTDDNKLSFKESNEPELIDILSEISESYKK